MSAPYEWLLARHIDWFKGVVNFTVKKRNATAESEDPKPKKASVKDSE